MHSFTTERLFIRPLVEQDRALFISLYTDAKIMRNISEPLSDEKADKAFNSSLSMMEKSQPKIMTWAIVSMAENRAIGIQGLTLKQAAKLNNKKNADIGIMLDAKANGKLYPEEAMGALMEYGFTKLKLTRINAHYASKNLATKRFVNKLGFTLPTTPHDKSGKTSYQYFDYQQWQHSLIKKLFINAVPENV